MTQRAPADIAKLFIKPPKDPKRWAHKIIARHKLGERFASPLSLQYAREVLGLRDD